MRIAANSLSSRSFCMISSVSFSNVPLREVPALLTTMSTLPNAFITSS